VNKFIVFVCLVLAGCGAAKRQSAAELAYNPTPVTTVVGHLSPVASQSCLYVVGDSLPYLEALQAHGLQLDVAVEEAYFEPFLIQLENTAQPLNLVILSKGGLRNESLYHHILVDRAKANLTPQAQAELLALLVNRLENDGTLVFVSPKNSASPNALQKTSSELANSFAFRKMSIDTSLSPHLQALILLK
jgi:hypothetical protein